MKRLLVFLFIILLLCCVNLSCVQDLTISNIFPNASVEVFTNTKSNIKGLSKIDNGVGEIIICDVLDLDYILCAEESIAGFTIKFDKNVISKDGLLKKINIQSMSKNNYGMLGFSNTVSKIIKNKFLLKIEKNKVNFQYFETKNNIFLGIPLILGSY